LPAVSSSTFSADSRAAQATASQINDPFPRFVAKDAVAEIPERGRIAWQRSATSRKVWLLIVSGANTARQLAIMVVMLLVIAKPRSCVSAGISRAKALSLSTAFWYRLPASLQVIDRW
jgi:TctA family transporter